MHYDFDGAPWIFPTWKELTGVRHGLFPKDDAQLPKGWTRQTANEIHSYFDQFRALTTEDQKLKFSSIKASKKSTQMVPGRKAWRDWVTKVWNDSKIHEKIITVLSAEGLHPYTLASQGDSWPDAAHWVPLVLNPVAGVLFGEECYSNGMERVRACLRNSTKALITRTWILLHNHLERSKKRIAILESEAIAAFEGSYDLLVFEFILNVG